MMATSIDGDSICESRIVRLTGRSPERYPLATSSIRAMKLSHELTIDQIVLLKFRTVVTQFTYIYTQIA